jgi:hypothetical protein
MQRRVASILLLWAFVVTAAPVGAQDRTFNRPLYRDDRLDWCLTWGAQCGKPAADAFCNRRRFSSALVFRAEVPSGQRTRLIGTNQVCTGSFCTPFAYVTCQDPIPRHRIFANPVWRGERLDVCREWGTNCGKPAADAFCRTKGFSDALHAEADPEPGYASTKVISSDQVCRGSFCTGFQQIICR